MVCLVVRFIVVSLFLLVSTTLPMVQAETDSDPETPPLPPTTATASEVEEGITLDWTPPVIGASAISHYIIYKDGEQFATVVGTSYVDSTGTTANSYGIASAYADGQESAIVPALPLLDVDCIDIHLHQFPFVSIDPINCIPFSDGVTTMVNPEPSTLLEVKFTE